MLRSRRSFGPSFGLVAALALAAGLAVPSTTAFAQGGTAITYQGLMERGGQKVNTATDMRFTLFDAATAGTAVGTQVARNAESVSNGLFNVPLDFGVNPYTADRALWMQIEVRNPAGSGSFVPMGARHRMTASPFSLATRGISVDDSGGLVGIGNAASAGRLEFARNGDGLRTARVGWASPSSDHFFDIINSSGGGLIRVLANTSIHLGNSDGTEWMRVNNAGNVGIGTDTPTSRLDVRGTDPAITVGTPTDTGGALYLGNPSHGVKRTYSATNDVGLFTRGGDVFLSGDGPGVLNHLAVKASGYVGIGTSSPSHRLTVQGDTNTMRLIGPTGSFQWNSRLNLGDADFVRISENDDDFLDFAARQGVRSASTFSAPAKNFRIDHPSDPQNKILNHGCIESDQYVNLYRGNAVIGNDGGVWIQLPTWMNDLNTDFSYQLTSVGAAQPNLFVAAKVNTNNQFRVAGGVPGAEVSWQITGVRHDAYVRSHPLVVEEIKQPQDRGTYLSPNSFGIFTPEELAKYGTK